MRNWHNIYTSSLKRIFKSVGGWVTICIFVLITEIMIFSQLLFFNNDYDAMRTEMLGHIFNYSLLVFTTLIFTILSTFLYQIKEMSFVLARPISRKDWVSAKFVAIITIVAILSIFIFLNWVILDAIVYHGTFGLLPGIFAYSFQWYVPFLLYFFVGLYCGVMVMLLSANMKAIVIFIINFSIIFLSTVPYCIGNAITDDSNHPHWMFNAFFLLPLCISICVSGGGIGLTFWQINNLKVKI